MAHPLKEEEMPTHPKHRKKPVSVDPEIHEQVVAMAELMDITPGELVEEAVVFYLRSSRAELYRRVQERMDALFARVDAIVETQTAGGSEQ